jgi:glycosyltransferase involved in cell wall biosynthesis
VNILVVSQWFPPEPGGGPARFLEMASRWGEVGHRVTVVAGMPNWPTGEVHRGYRRRLLVREQVGNVRVLRSWVYATANEGRARRIVNHSSFLASGSIAALARGGQPDVVVATSPPLFAGAAGMAVARARRRPLVFDVRDLWPDAIFALGQLRGRATARALRALERRLYAGSAAVVAVSAPFAEPIRARGARRVEVIPNGADLDAFSPGPADGDLRRTWGWDGRFVVLYAGTIGLSHGLGTVLDAAHRLRDTDVSFVLVGAGAEREGLARAARDRGLSNVQLLPLQPRERMPSVYRSADLCLVSLRPLPLFDSFVPSKLFEIMACGKPVLAAVSGTAGELVRDAGAGITIPPGSADALVNAVCEVKGSGQLEEMGRSGRDYVERYHDRSVLASRYLELLTEIAGR